MLDSLLSIFSPEVSNTALILAAETWALVIKTKIITTINKDDIICNEYWAIDIIAETWVDKTLTLWPLKL